MKNTKKIISLVLAICMLASLAISASAANTVDASGGTGTSSVTLSSTADGSLDGDPAATKMSVSVPTVLPVAVGTDGSSDGWQERFQADASGCCHRGLLYVRCGRYLREQRRHCL